MKGALTTDFEAKEFLDHRGCKFCLIAYYQLNKVTGQSGYVVYQTDDLDNWNAYTAQPLIDMILFNSPKEALDLGEQIVKSASDQPVIGGN